MLPAVFATEQCGSVMKQIARGHRSVPNCRSIPGTVGECRDKELSYALVQINCVKAVADGAATLSKCGSLMWLARIMPHQPGWDQRTFECDDCGPRARPRRLWSPRGKSLYATVEGDPPVPGPFLFAVEFNLGTCKVTAAPRSVILMSDMSDESLSQKRTPGSLRMPGVG